MLYVTFWNLFGTLWNMVPMPQQVTRDSTKNFTMAHQSWTICSMYVQCTHHLSKRFVIKTPFFNLENDIIFDVWISNFVFSSRLKTHFLHPIKILVPTLLLHYTHSPYCTFNERVVHSLLEITDTLSNSWKWRMSCCAARSHYSIWLWVCRAAAAPRAASLTDELCIDPIPPTLPFISLYVGTYICGGWLT